MSLNPNLDCGFAQLGSMVDQDVLFFFIIIAFDYGIISINNKYQPCN